MGLFGFGNKDKTRLPINWTRLTEGADFVRLVEKDSFVQPVVFFKHSTRCSISAMALNRLESDWDLDADRIVPVYLDLIAYRSVSDQMANVLRVVHQSPQLLIVKDGKCVYNASHSQINVQDIKEWV